MTGLVLAVVGVVAAGTAARISNAASAVMRCRALFVPRRSAGSLALPLPVRNMVHAADVSDEHVRSALLGMRLGAMCCVLVGAVAGVVAGAAALSVITLVPLLALAACRDRRDRRLLASLPDALDLVGRSLRSGSSVPQALAEVAATIPGPLAGAFDRIVAGTRRGESLSHALQRFATNSPLADVRVAVAALTMAAESGAGPSRALDGVSESLRDSQRLRTEIGALTSQARASATVLIALPVVFVALNAALDPSALVFLVEDDLGRLCLGVGLALDGAGWVWMRSLVKRVQA